MIALHNELLTYNLRLLCFSWHDRAAPYLHRTLYRRKWSSNSEVVPTLEDSFGQLRKVQGMGAGCKE